MKSRVGIYNWGMGDHGGETVDLFQTKKKTGGKSRHSLASRGGGSKRAKPKSTTATFTRKTRLAEGIVRPYPRWGIRPGGQKGVGKGLRRKGNLAVSV